MASPRRIDDRESPHARPEPPRRRSPLEYDATHGLPVDGQEAGPGGGESEAARRERLAASPESAAEEAGAEAGPESARREALGASPEVQAEKADELLEEAARQQQDE